MTVLISDPITTAVEKTLDSQGFPQMSMQLGTEEGLNRVLGDITWTANLEKIKGYRASCSANAHRVYFLFAV